MFFDDHLANLNPDLLAIFPQQVEILLARKDEPAWKSLVASTLVILAVDLEEFLRGDRRLNLELTIACYNLALLEYTRAQLPLDWAMTQTNRAIVYQNRIEGDKRENLEEAIRGYDLALLEYTRAQLPLDWAAAQMNRANIYSDRIEGDKRENLEEAIRGCDLALLEYTRAQLPLDWAMTQMNRANVYQDRIEGERRENLEEAIRGYNLALLERTREKLPIQWATTTENLAILHTGENDNLTIDFYCQVLEVFTPTSLPINALKASRGLARIYFNQGEWQLALDTYETAMQAVETSRRVVNEENRQQLLKDALSIYENAIQCAINLGNYPQAIQYTERIRSRQLVDLMGTKDLYPDAEIPAEIQQYLAEYERLSRQIQHLREHGSPDDGTTRSTRNAASLSRDNTAIQALEAQKRAQYLKIRAFDPAIAGQIDVEPIPFAAIQKLITTPHTAILTYSTKLPGANRTAKLTKFSIDLYQSTKRANPRVSFDLCHLNPDWSKRTLSADWKRWKVDRAFVQLYSEPTFRQELVYAENSAGIAITDKQLHRLPALLKNPKIKVIFIFPLTGNPRMAAANLQLASVK